MTTTITTVCDLIAALDTFSHQLDNGEYEGAALVQWNAKQLALMDERILSTSPHNDEETLQRSRKACLRRILLEDEELSIHNSLPMSTKVSDTRKPSMSYETPSVMHERLTLARTESELLDNEANKLRYRLKHAKAASQSLKHTSKKLQTIITQLDRDIQQEQELSNELSIKIDATIAGVVSSAHQLLDMQCNPNNKDHNADSFRTRLLTLSKNRSEVVSNAERRFSELQDATDSLPTPEYVNEEASRLHKKFEELNTRCDPEKLFNAAYEQELGKILAKLKTSEDFEQALVDIMSEAESAEDTIPDTRIDVQREIERAWEHDQLAILLAKEKVLDETQSFVDENLLPPLRRLSDDLKSAQDDYFETEALVNALLEELEEIADDVENAKNATLDDNGIEVSKHLQEYRNNALKEKLKELRHLRPNDAQALVLLDDEDLDKEVSSLRARQDSLRQQEEEWLKELQSVLHKLSETYEPLTEAIYKNSPVFTSPAFGPDKEVEQLGHDARGQAEKMTDAIIRLQKDTTLGSRVIRKMNTFVEKWG
ncbi:hypothetical protein C8Q75DRAFT_730940 [Abortiporus biennis]|nr:hypothetical protein C8Q75DRAFT_730940 [Abortiporus biennis]